MHKGAYSLGTSHMAMKYFIKLSMSSVLHSCSSKQVLVLRDGNAD